MNHRTLVIALGTLTLAPLGCSTADNVDLGSTKGSALVDYAATWTGYAEAYKFDKGTSDRVRITLDANGEGTLEVGDKPLYPAPTDFDVAYPPGDDLLADRVTRFRPGFRYPLHAARVETGRLRLYVNPYDSFATWCEHQTSYKDTVRTSNPPVDSYYCAPSGNFVMGNECTIDTFDGGPPIPIDCGKYLLCQALFPQPCACSASGCTATHSEYEFIQFDAALDAAGTNMVGTLVVHDPSGDARLTVRLTSN